MTLKSLVPSLACALMVTVSGPALAQTAPGGDRDAFYWLSEMNKASTVMVVETGIVPAPLGKTIATSVAKVIDDAAKDRKLRSGDYLRVEPLIIAAGGPDVTRLHSGRSRQDLGATSRRLAQRDQVLATMESLDRARAALLDLAAKHPDAIVPAYTHGVQAQPISFGHFVLGYTEALERGSGELRAAYESANRSPFGSAALGTSSFAVDRRRLAELLGFDAVMTNSLYANQISPIETGAELTGAAASITLVVSALTADVQAQYRMATPWLILTEGELTGVSSIMPQKRNPTALNTLRGLVGDVMGEVSAFQFKAHSAPAGMSDYKGMEPQAALQTTARLLDELAATANALNFNPQRALDEVNADYSATTELADILQRDADVPFRVGHHFASELVTFGRGKGLRPAQIRYADAQRIYAEAAHAYGAPGKLPLDEKTFRRALTAENMVASSRGLGGPQPAEVARMLAAQRDQLTKDRAWTAGAKQRLQAASANLNAAFERIRNGS